jgi:hypothetical protein
MTASAISSTAARRSSSSSFASLPATSTVRSLSEGPVPLGCCAQSCNASRCCVPIVARGPERSRSAETLRTPRSAVGAGVATAGPGDVHATVAMTAMASALMARSSGARAVGERVPLRVDVA